MSQSKVSTTHGGVDGLVVTSTSLSSLFSLKFLFYPSVHLIASSLPPPSLFPLPFVPSLPPSLPFPPSLPSSLPHAPFLPASLPHAPFLPASLPHAPFLPPPSLPSSGCRQEEGGGHVWSTIHPCGIATLNCSEFDRAFDDYGIITRQCTKDGGHNCKIFMCIRIYITI